MKPEFLSFAITPKLGIQNSDDLSCNKTLNWKGEHNCNGIQETSGTQKIIISTVVSKQISLRISSECQISS
jgi:hypothetical protein